MHHLTMENITINNNTRSITNINDRSTFTITATSIKEGDPFWMIFVDRSQLVMTLIGVIANIGTSITLKNRQVCELFPWLRCIKLRSAWPRFDSHDSRDVEQCLSFTGLECEKSTSKLGEIWLSAPSCWNVYSSCPSHLGEIDQTNVRFPCWVVEDCQDHLMLIELMLYNKCFKFIGSKIQSGRLRIPPGITPALT